MPAPTEPPSPTSSESYLRPSTPYSDSAVSSADDSSSGDSAVLSDLSALTDDEDFELIPANSDSGSSRAGESPSDAEEEAVPPARHRRTSSSSSTLALSFPDPQSFQHVDRYQTPHTHKPANVKPGTCTPERVQGTSPADSTISETPTIVASSRPKEPDVSDSIEDFDHYRYSDTILLEPPESKDQPQSKHNEQLSQPLETDPPADESSCSQDSRVENLVPRPATGPFDADISTQHDVVPTATSCSSRICVKAVATVVLVLVTAGLTVFGTRLSMGSAVEVKPSQPFESPTTIPPLHKVLNVIAHALPSNPLGLTRHIEAEPPFKASKERWIPLFAEAPSDSRNIASLTQSLNRFDDKTSTKALVTQRHSQPKELSLLKGRNASTASASTTLRQKKDPQEATKPTHALSVAKAGMVVVEEASFPSCGISSLNLSALWSPLIRNASQAIWLKVGMMDSGLGEQFDVPRKSLRRYLSSIQQAHRHYSSLVSSRLVWWHPRGTLVIKQSRANLFRLVSCVKRRHHGLLNRFAPIRHSTSVLGQSQTGRARISQLAKLRSDEILTAVTSQMQQVAQSSPLRLSAVQSVSSRAVRRYTCRARSISRMLKHKYSSASGTEFTKPSRPRTILSKLKEHLGC